jgi:hypothetical protein
MSDLDAKDLYVKAMCMPVRGRTDAAQFAYSSRSMYAMSAAKLLPQSWAQSRKEY